MRTIKIIGGGLLVLATAACNAGLPPGTLVQRAYVPAPVYAPPPPPPPSRCFFRDGPYGPERVCRPAYY